jgi:phosphoglycolate phosphatase
MLKPFLLAIFDLDDTLIQSHINFRQIRLTIAELFTPPLSEEFITKTAILELLEILKQKHPEKYEEGYKRMTALEYESCENATVMLGATEVSSTLKQNGITPAIYTNNSRRTVNMYLKKPEFSFLQEFTIFTRDDITHPKPHPEGLNAIMELKKIPNEQTIYIGDSYIDAIAANKANIRFIWFNSREIDPNLFPSPPYATLSKWSELEKLLHF